MEAATINEVLTHLYENKNPEEWAKMKLDELIQEAQEIQDEINQARMEDEADEQMYGNPDDDEYDMSESHRQDVKQEEWDWLKDA